MLHFQIMKKAVYCAMKGNLQRRYTMERLHIYPDDKVPDDVMKNISNQIRQLRPVPIRLDKYPEEVVSNFPKVMDWPKDYVLRWIIVVKLLANIGMIHYILLLHCNNVSLYEVLIKNKYIYKMDTEFLSKHNYKYLYRLLI